MKVLHINTLDFFGGAAKAMFRLHTALTAAGVDSGIAAGFVAKKGRRVYSVPEEAAKFENAFQRYLDKISRPIDMFLGLAHMLYPGSFYLRDAEIFKEADVINLHNLHSNYFNYTALPAWTKDKPVVWTLHDMWPLTGHCSYSYECSRWASGCFKCPLLRGGIKNLRRSEPRPVAIDFSKITWRIKRDTYKKSLLNIACPSEWMCQQAKKGILSGSAGFAVIPNGVDIDLFKPQDKIEARKQLGLPQEDFILLFPSESTSQYRKGFQYLVSAIKSLDIPVSLMVFGRKGVPADLRQACRILETGYIDSDELSARYYAASDLIVAPTLADNQPLVIVEAFACGIPVVAFDAGGVGEMVWHMQTGYKAVYKDVKDLANGIKILHNDKALYSRLSAACRSAAVNKYSLRMQADRYISFYKESIDRHAKLS